MINITIERKHVYLLAVIVTLAALLVPASAWASNRFTDVPDTSIFHDDIEWLADAGVTKGCNPPANDEFCPKDVVTREQLAAFMHRFSAAGTRVLAGTVSKDGSVATGDITSVTDNGASYTVRFSGQDLTECSAIASAGGNDAVPKGETANVLFSVGVTPGTGTDLVVVTPTTTENTTSDGSSFHIIVVCP